MTPYDLIVSERRRQDSKWGGWSHDDQHSIWTWAGLIIKQLGRAMMDPPLRFNVIKSQMIKVAALAVAAYESMDRLERRQ